MEDNKKTHEIDIVALCSELARNYKILCVCGAAGAVIGLIVAFSKPKEYTATVVLAPEASSGSGLSFSGGLLNMASSFGIDLSNKTTSDAIYPELYPDIIESQDFLLSLFDVPVRLKDDNSTRTYTHHLVFDTKIPFWSYPMVWLAEALRKPEVAPQGGNPGDKDPFRITQIDAMRCEAISALITCNVNKKTGTICLSVTDQDPMVAAIMADTLQHRIQQYVTSYRTKKARIDYDYYDKMAAITLDDYEKARREFSDYCDSHTNSVLTSVSTEQEALENRMSDLYTTYSAVLKLRDQARAKIQESTPAFTILQSAKMPHRPSSTSRLLTLMACTLLGAFGGALYVIFRKQNA